MKYPGSEKFKISSFVFVVFVVFIIFFQVFGASQAFSASGRPANPCRGNVASISSNNQFSELWGDPDLKYRMTRFFSQGILKDAPALADKLILLTDKMITANPNASDDEIYGAQRRLIVENWREFQIAFHRDDWMRVHQRVLQLKSLFPMTPRNYFDVGAGDGSIANGMMEEWHLTQNSTFGIEVGQYEHPKPINWLTYEKNGSLPLPDSSVQAITLLMVLHHIEDPDTVLSEIHRVLALDGLLVVRETDAFNQEEKRFNQVLDTMFYRVFSENPSIPLPNHYQSRLEWREFISNFGFTVQREVVLEPHNPFSPVYLVFTKNGERRH